MARVLIVDDEEKIRFSFKKILTDTGHDVVAASHLVDAKAILSCNEFDVAVIDRILGTSNGLELVKHVREVQPFCEPIFISGYPSFESASETLQYDVFAYLTKPIRKKKLCQTVEDAVRKSKIKKETKHNERILQSLFDSSPNAIVISDLSNKTRFVNPTFTRIFGYSKEEITGEYIPYIPDWDQENTESEWNDLVAGKPVLERESQRLTKDGRAIDVAITQSVCRDNNGGLTDILTIIRDITEKRKIEKQFRHAQKMEALGTLAGGIAHDFNNILFIITAYTELLISDMPKSSKARDNIMEIDIAASRAVDLVRQIRTFSRHEEQEKRPIEIQPVLKEALRLLRSSLPTTIEFRQKIDKNCGTILADPTQIHQVIMNLCTNAYHAMQENGGILEVNLSRVVIGSDDIDGNLSLPPGQYLMLTVSDTGHGIDKLVMDQIFEPYFTTKAKREGAGMGLATVHGIVESDGGAITVESELDKGTMFCVYFPCAEESANKNLLSIESVPGGKERILLVDDDKQIIRMGKQMLETLGYNVTTLADSVVALETFRAHPNRFDLVIIDKIMPKMTGTQLAEELMRIRPDIHIILITGLEEGMTAEDCKKMNIKECVMKHAGTRELAKAIRRVLDC